MLTSFFASVARKNVAVTAGWDLSGASYDSKYLSTASQIYYGLVACALDTTGTKCYACDVNDVIYQYTLSSAWDLSTGTYASKNGSINATAANTGSLSFKPDGTKLYVCDRNDKAVYQFSLSSAWDISTVSYDSKSASISTQMRYPKNGFMSNDGTKYYVVDNDSGLSSRKIYQYSLSTAWDISTMSYASKNFSVVSQASSPYSMFIKSDGLRYFLYDANGKKLYQYSMSSAWDISTSSYDSKSFDTSSQITTAGAGFFVRPDGTNMYVANSSNTDMGKIYQYSL